MKISLHRGKHRTAPDDDQRLEPGLPDPLAAVAAHRNLILTGSGVWAYYLMGEVDWPNRSTDERRTILNAQMHRWSELVGYRVRLHGVSDPFPHEQWAMQEYARPGRLADVPDSTNAAAYLQAAQERIVFDYAAHRPATMIGVRIATGKFRPEHLAHLATTAPLPDRLGALTEVRHHLGTVNDVMGRDGFNSRPLSAKSLGWLFHYSISLGAPVPAALLADRAGVEWDRSDMDGFTDSVRIAKEPYSPTCTVKTLRGGQQATHHVGVVQAHTWRQRDPLDPNITPWLMYPQGMDFKVDWCATFDVLDGRDLTSEAELTTRQAQNMKEHYEEHNYRAPALVRHGITRAEEIEDEVSAGSKEVATRLRGTVLFAVHGDTQDETMKRSSQLISDMAQEAKVTLEHRYGQYQLLRAFIPGEPAPDRGMVTQQPGYFFAGAVPNGTTAAGDRQGFLVGPIANSPDVLVFDLLAGPRRNRSGLLVVGGDQGAGKSTLLMGLIDYFVRFHGAHGRGVLVDPAGPMRAMENLPHLRGKVRHVSASSIVPGAFNPYTMVPNPRREVYDTEDEWQQAILNAAVERMSLMQSYASGLLPPKMTEGDVQGHIAAAIELTVNEVGGEYGTNPWEVISRLKAANSETSRTVGALLEARAATSGALFFPARGRDLTDSDLRSITDSPLTILTMKGMTMPRAGVPRSELGADELAAGPILSALSRFALRAMYEPGPTFVGMDEGAILAHGHSALRPFMVRGAYDTRKHDTCLAITTQNLGPLLAIDPDMPNLTGAAAIGRMKTEAAARAALPFLGLPEDMGYEKIITGQDTGQMMWRDYGRPEEPSRTRSVLVDRQWWAPELVKAADTTPRSDGPSEGLSILDSVDEVA